MREIDAAAIGVVAWLAGLTYRAGAAAVANRLVPRHVHMTEGHRAAVDKHAAPQGGVATDDPPILCLPTLDAKVFEAHVRTDDLENAGRLVGCDNAGAWTRADDQQGLRGAGLNDLIGHLITAGRNLDGILAGGIAIGVADRRG